MHAPFEPGHRGFPREENALAPLRAGFRPGGPVGGALARLVDVVVAGAEREVAVGPPLERLFRPAVVVGGSRGTMGEAGGVKSAGEGGEQGRKAFVVGIKTLASPEARVIGPRSARTPLGGEDRRAEQNTTHVDRHAPQIA